MLRNNYSVTVALIMVIAVSLLPSNLFVGNWCWFPDWMWILLAVIGLFIIKLSKNNTRIVISGFIKKFTLIPLILQIIFRIAGLLESSNLIWILSLVAQTWAATGIGYMTALAINSYTDIVLSERWILVFSFLFAMTLSGIYLFFQFGFLYTGGYPVFNDQLAGLSPKERNRINLTLMMPCVVSTPVSFVTTYILRYWTKKSNLSDTTEADISG